MFEWAGEPSPHAEEHELADFLELTAWRDGEVSAVALSRHLARLGENDYSDGVPEEAEARSRGRWRSAAVDAGILLDRCRVVDFCRDPDPAVRQKVREWTRAAAEATGLPGERVQGSIVLRVLAGHPP